MITGFQEGTLIVNRCLQWSNQPSYDSKYITDYDIVKNSGWYSWKVTDLVRNWYQRGNYGMMLSYDGWFDH